MKLVVIFKSARRGDASMNYQDYVCTEWSINDNLLVIQNDSGLRYLPLVNIESFIESED